MKKLMKSAATALGLTALFLFFGTELFGQTEPNSILDQLKVFLNQYYATEAVFLAMTVGITKVVREAFALTDKKIVMGVSFLVTLICGLLGFFLDIGIFASMGIVDLIVFVFLKTFAGNGFFDWIKLIFGKKNEA